MVGQNKIIKQAPPGQRPIERAPAGVEVQGVGRSCKSSTENRSAGKVWAHAGAKKSYKLCELRRGISCRHGAAHEWVADGEILEAPSSLDFVPNDSRGIQRVHVLAFRPTSLSWCQL